MNYLFISPERLKEDTVIIDSADNSVISHAILTTQNSHIRKCVGEGLYQELIHQVNAGGVSDRNRKLLDNYLRITLKYYVLYELCNPATYYMIAGDGWIGGSENKPTHEQIEQVKNYYLNHAEWYGKRVTKYLQQNHLQYPLYLEGHS